MDIPHHLLLHFIMQCHSLLLLHTIPHTATPPRKTPALLLCSLEPTPLPPPPTPNLSPPPSRTSPLSPQFQTPCQLSSSLVTALTPLYRSCALPQNYVIHTRLISLIFWTRLSFPSALPRRIILTPSGCQHPIAQECSPESSIRIIYGLCKLWWTDLMCWLKLLGQLYVECLFLLSSNHHYSPQTIARSTGRSLMFVLFQISLQMYMQAAPIILEIYALNFTFLSPQKINLVLYCYCWITAMSRVATVLNVFIVYKSCLDTTEYDDVTWLNLSNT